MTERADTDDEDTLRDFHDAVNMSASELEQWLATEDSRRAGQHKGGAESVGHASGRRIVTLLRTKKSELRPADRQHMRKVIGYVHRHLAQRPAGDVSATTWRRSLMNWGHDPTK